jgi:dihydrofolate synthase/folylpolyglutamate synthase
MMTFREAGEYLLGTINETASRRNPQRLERMSALLRNLGDPHLQYPTIHVGGTSGKGSTCTMIAAALTASGRVTGLHTKPHLSSMTERARIDGRAVEEEEFARLLDEMMPALQATAQEYGRPSYYETLLALAYVHFREAKVDVAVIEVGVGGSLDGTNLLRPETSVITNVGLDHTEILGDTVELIARDKAGIAKAGVPLVSDAVSPAREVIEAACGRAGAPFIAVSEHAQVVARSGERYGQSFDVVTQSATYTLALPVLGRFQQRNAATAIVALETLRADLRPTPAQVEAGFANLVIPGRMEFFPAHPAVVFDVAHNPDKARSLAEALRETFPGKRFTFVIAVSDEKDALGVLTPLFGLPSSFIFTAFELPGRTSTRPSRLANMAEQHGFAARAIGEPVEALAIARRNGDGDGIVVVTGSTFVVGTLRDWWLTNVAERSRS